jgi:hypothetical protein
MKTMASTKFSVLLNLAYEPVTKGLRVGLDSDQWWWMYMTCSITHQSR